MSQVLDQPNSLPREMQLNEFDYHPVPPLAPVSLAIGLMSAIALLWDVGLVIPIVGITLAAVCLGQIRRSEGAFGGRLLARTALLLCSAFLVSGTATHAYMYATEVPEGHLRVNFVNDISKHGFVFDNGQVNVAEPVQKLDGEKVFLKGYMYPTRDTRNLQSFILCKDSGDCCFGGQPQLTDMILIEMQEGKTVDYREGLVSVAGTFHTDAGGLESSGLTAVYKLDGTYFGGARTSY